jgi:hypothetical protein
LAEITIADKYIGDKEKNIAEIEERNIRLKNRKRLLNIMNDCEDKSTTVQDFFSNKITV